jgi:hypothetical protein
VSKFLGWFVFDRSNLQLFVVTIAGAIPIALVAAIFIYVPLYVIGNSLLILLAAIIAAIMSFMFGHIILIPIARKMYWSLENKKKRARG